MTQPLNPPTNRFTIRRRLWAVVSWFAVLSLAPLAQADHAANHVDVVVDDLSDKAQTGQMVFNQNCAACHGLNGQGSDAGPPLIHPVYNPGHHSNKSFYRAVTQGVRQHHWQFGNMPPQPHVGFSELTYILAFVREVQVRNGIESAAH